MKRVIKKILKKFYYNFIKHRKKVRNYLQPTGHILLYHRVAEAKTDPHLLCVSPENFRQQIKFLKENFNILPLSKMVEDIKGKGVRGKSIAITFDDGYADNLHNAVPILEELGVPATIFVTASYIDSVNPFYWDESTPIAERGRPMTSHELLQLSQVNLIEIGAHTVNHLNLGKLLPEEQAAEIGPDRQILEKIARMPILSFAYPFGGQNSFNKEIINLIKRQGFRYACANIHERATNRSNVYALPRFVVRNWTVGEFKKEMEKWL